MDDLAGTIEDTKLADALGERYLAYALSTIMSRSLPDVRDGLKPVHRRLIYAMHLLKLDPASGFKKCARVVGDVIGKFHPHGDAAVYETLVRLAQEFAARYPLVEGQGNFGNIDGDNAAAMRYTEARLTEVARALLTGIDDDAVDFRATYDGEESEPVVLPAGFPNLLANGAAGIAVGMATSIPPHNAGEVCAAALHLIRHPGASTADLLQHMPGPDFPTGGTLVEPAAAIAQAYETGRGGFRLRAKWEVERGKGGRGRHALLLADLLGLLRAWWQEGRRQGVMRPGGWLFPGQDPAKPITTRQLSRVLQAWPPSRRRPTVHNRRGLGWPRSDLPPSGPCG